MANVITDVALTIRGHLCEPTGEQDMPYRPTILSCDEQGQERDGLRIDSFDPQADPQELRKCLQSALDAYQADNGSKPKSICIKDVGTFAIRQDLPQSDLPLQNKVALVTGAAGAIGYGVCQALLENGCFLAASDLPGQKLDDFAANLEKTAPGRVIGVAMDVTQECSVEEGFQQIVKTWGGIDIVVVNAGIAHVCQIKDMDLEDFRRLEKVNVEGALLTLKVSANSFILQGIGGDIVVMSTKNVPNPGASFGAYSATKAAAHQLGRIASLELAPHNVRVNMVAPDAVFTEGEYKSGLWEEVGPGRGMGVRGGRRGERRPDSRTGIRQGSRPGAAGPHRRDGDGRDRTRHHAHRSGRASRESRRPGIGCGRLCDQALPSWRIGSSHPGCAAPRPTRAGCVQRDPSRRTAD